MMKAMVAIDNRYYALVENVSFDNWDERMSQVETKKEMIVESIDNASWRGVNTETYDIMYNEIREVERALEAWLLQ